MTQSELLKILKELVLNTAAKANPMEAQELAKMRASIEGEIKLDSHLASLGWDSLQFTWLLVAIEERLDIDTSNLSLFDIFTIGDLLTELQALINHKRIA